MGNPSTLKGASADGVFVYDKTKVPLKLFKFVTKSGKRTKKKQRKRTMKRNCVEKCIH